MAVLDEVKLCVNVVYALFFVCGVVGRGDS